MWMSFAGRMSVKLYPWMSFVGISQYTINYIWSTEKANALAVRGLGRKPHIYIYNSNKI